MWECSVCPAENGPDATQCYNCGTPRAILEHVPPRHHWRITLPNHVPVPLPEGHIAIGRQTPGPIGSVLQLFEHVSRHHLDLDVTPEELRVSPVADTNPVFTFADGGDLARPETAFHPRRMSHTESVAPHETLTLCLGQCCFVRLDRGEA